MAISHHLVKLGEIIPEFEPRVAKLDYGSGAAGRAFAAMVTVIVPV